jgi:hypothetical protein
MVIDNIYLYNYVTLKIRFVEVKQQIMVNLFQLIINFIIILLIDLICMMFY